MFKDCYSLFKGDTNLQSIGYLDGAFDQCVRKKRRSEEEDQVSTKPGSESEQPSTV